MVDTNITDVVQDIFDDFDRLPDLIAARWKKRIQTFVVDWQRTMTRSISGPLRLGSKKGANEKLATRSGGLKRSFAGRVLGSKLDDLSGEMFSTAGKIALIHEFGTKGAGGILDPITPRKAQFLTIPLPGALTRSGRPRQGLETVGDWIEQEGAFFLDFGGDLFVVTDEGEAGDIVPLFVLKKRVDIAPRLNMTLTFESMLPKFVDSLDEAVGEAIIDAAARTRRSAP